MKNNRQQQLGRPEDKKSKSKSSYSSINQIKPTARVLGENESQDISTLSNQ